MAHVLVFLLHVLGYVPCPTRPQQRCPLAEDISSECGRLDGLRPECLLVDRYWYL